MVGGWVGGGVVVAGRTDAGMMREGNLIACALEVDSSPRTVPKNVASGVGMMLIWSPAVVHGGGGPRAMSSVTASWMRTCSVNEMGSCPLCGGSCTHQGVPNVRQAMPFHRMGSAGSGSTPWVPPSSATPFSSWNRNRSTFCCPSCLARLP